VKELKIGVVGVGIGRHHAKAFQQHPHCKVVALADVDEKRLAGAAKELGIEKTYRSAEEMLANEKLDICSVATPNKFHKPLTLAALKAGCHVLCEKPMAMSAVEARQMLAAAKKARRRIMINFSFRFTPQSWALKKEVDAGALGDVYFAQTRWMRRRGMPGFGGWFGTKALSGGGPLIDLGVHRVDLALWLMGYPQPEWVIGRTYDHIAREKAKAEKKTFDVEDLAAAFVTFKNGASLEIVASWAGNIKERELMETRLLGTKGGLVQRNLNETYQFEAELFGERNGIQCDFRPHDPLPDPGGAMRHFADCILANKPHTATGEEGLTVMELLDAIYKSAATGRPVKVH
jgi:predicted dehydrogenase